MKRNNLKHLSTGELIYWPSDRNNQPDPVGFCGTKDIPQDFALAKSCFDISSECSPVLITLTADALNQEKQRSLSNRHTYWDDLRRLINERLTSNISLKTEEDIEAAMPEHTEILKICDHPILKQKIEEKKKTRCGLAPVRNTQKQRIT
jgi:hypothetical protein